MRILGLDPSLNSTGWGVIELLESHEVYVDSGLIRFPQCWSWQSKLESLGIEVGFVFHEQQPLRVGIEMPILVKGKKGNPDTFRLLSAAFGVCIVNTIRRWRETPDSKEELPVYPISYLPTQIKKAVTGHGNAGKEAVRVMVAHLLGIAEKYITLDESDALAVALCAAHQWQAKQALAKSDI